jgi:predicted nucleic acid-binding protein
MRILVDSSVWIDFFRAHKAPHTERLKALLHNGEDICICGHILAEVLRGTRHDQQYLKVERYFEVLDFLTMNKKTFKVSADMFRHLRSNGITLKNTVDTFIASVALRHDVYLLHNDRDFDLIATEFPLKVVPVNNEQ